MSASPPVRKTAARPIGFSGIDVLRAHRARGVEAVLGIEADHDQTVVDAGSADRFWQGPAAVNSRIGPHSVRQV